MSIKQRLGHLETKRGKADEGKIFCCLVGKGGALTDADGKPLTEAEYRQRSQAASVCYRIVRRAEASQQTEVATE